ncbi:hypothetical protein [Pseudothauera rhizosphaerae]|uniref:Uncharacterized protein n=1 Tax=Pseudothauera rhizosphaerae TaxID=2565932 RepID=A0A4S4AMQ0_9RHOO|nr:hypothetical protein [Pseudothauera rhizosphaerae]THF60903.1 hypothetical protein E6O51_11780 [Pseudothauera rhizosphaerae]
MIAARTLLIGPVGMPLPLAAAGFTQTYATIRGGSLLRLADGSGLQQSRWRKLSTTVSGSGILPAPLAALDWDAPLILGCVAPRGIWTAGAPVELPAARRADVAPFALAAVGAGMVRASIEVAAGVATIAPVAGATGYCVYYYPQLTVVSAGPMERFDVFERVAGFDVEFEEV